MGAISKIDSVHYVYGLDSFMTSIYRVNSKSCKESHHTYRHSFASAMRLSHVVADMSYSLKAVVRPSPFGYTAFVS